MEDLHPLTCLRVVASIMVILHHATMLLLVPGPDTDTEGKVSGIYDTYSNSLTLRALVYCWAGVCAFFGLCGYFATRELFSKLAASASDGRGWSSLRAVLRYYLRRFLRLVPLHWCALALTWALFTRRYTSSSGAEPATEHWQSARDFWWSPSVCTPDGSWVLHNLAFINNYQTFGGCYAVTWSNAAQLQFYAVFPVILLALRPRAAGFPRRVGVTAAAVVLLNVLQRAYAYEYIPAVSLPVAIFGAVGAEAGAASAADMIVNYTHTYFSTHARVGQFAVGVLLAIAHQSPFWAKAFGQRGRFSTLLGVLCVATMAAPFLFSAPWSATPKADVWARPQQHLFLLVNYSPLSAFAYTAVGLMAVDKAGFVGQALNWLFALLPRKLWQELARVSYAAYLMHAFALVGVVRCFPLLGISPKEIVVQPALLAAYLTLAVTASFTVAAPFTYLIEARFYSSSRAKTATVSAAADRQAAQGQSRAPPAEPSSKISTDGQAPMRRNGMTAATRRGAAAAAVYI